ncbi:MAG: fluoride efflux transporter CrcB [Myxococcota bacterium]
MPVVVWIALGGAAGTVARYYVSAAMVRLVGPALPAGTFTVNLVGSFLLGVLFAIGSGSDRIGPTVMLALSTGFMGGFTTYSTFSLETFKLAQAGEWGAAAGYVGLTVVSAFAGTAAGYALGARAVG